MIIKAQEINDKIVNFFLKIDNFLYEIGDKIF